MASSEFDRIWCLQYDQDSYHRSMIKVKFSKYLNMILSNQYYPIFQTQVYKQLQDESEWNERSWALLQMFEYFNAAFAIKEFQSNVKFIADKKTRKTFGSFRMWIDLEKLYLLSFLKMDRMEFQEDRIYFSLYRTMFFLFDLLSEYQVSDFKRQFLQKIHLQITKHTKRLQKCLPSYMQLILKSIRGMIPNFINKQPLVDPKQKDEVKKITFRKLSRSYDVMPEIGQRLSNNIQFQTKLRQMKEISDIAESAEIRDMTKEVEHLYDPRIRIANALRRQSELNNKPYQQQKFTELLTNYQNKQKWKLAPETPYQSIMRAGHNPYDESNYAIYGETLGIDMNQKQNLEKKEDLSEVEEQPENQNALYYDPKYLEKMQKMQIGSVAVTYKDLNSRAIESERDKVYSQDNTVLLRNLQWTQENNGDGGDNSNDDDDDKHAPATTLRSVNLKKNLENNTLFQKHDEQQKQKSIYLLKKAFRNGLQSDILYHLHQKSSQIYTQMQTSKMLNLTTKSVVDRNKFDSLRKVAQFHSINKKIGNWLKMDKVPNLYPRGIDQIKKFYVDVGIEGRKGELALEEILG